MLRMIGCASTNACSNAALCPPRTFNIATSRIMILMLNRRLKTDDGTSMTAGVLLAILLLAIMPAETRGQSPVPKTPALSGIVVDALTGKPVGGVDVTLRASLRVASFGGGGDKPLRYENSTTSPDGRF